jgi:pyruvate dehydrogenase E1 component beta subunit
VAPANPFDHKGLMAAALRSDDPVVFIEHKALLLKKAETFLSGQHVPEERYSIPLGRAKVVREGSDLTLVTLSASVEYALEAAQLLEQDNINLEIIDLRSVVPLDIDTVLTSVAKTKRLLVVDEDYLSFGLSAEVITRVLERGGTLEQLARHAVPDVPIPAAKSLEQAVVPSVSSIAQAVRDMAARS